MVLGLGWSVTCRVHIYSRFLIKAQLFIEHNLDCSKLEFDFISGSLLSVFFVHIFYLWTVPYYICNLKLAVKDTLKEQR